MRQVISLRQGKRKLYIFLHKCTSAFETPIKYQKPAHETRCLKIIQKILNIVTTLIRKTKTEDSLFQPDFFSIFADSL